MKHLLCLILFFSFMGVDAQKKQVQLIFAGDAMQHLPQVNAARTDNGYNYDSCFYLIKEHISASDIACVNFETVLGGQPYTGYPQFSSPDEFAFGLKNAGFDIFFLANNHTADRGRKGLERTIDVLDSIGIKHTGTFKSGQTRDLYYPLMIIKNGIRIAFLNYTYGTNGLPVKEPNIVNLTDSNLIKRDLFFTKRYKPDIIIAGMHWGEEYHTHPSKDQKKLADLLLRNGVRIVIGHHSHTVQPFVVNTEDGNIRNVVYYSLGNFISNQRKPGTDGGMLAEIMISKKDENAPAVIESCGYSLVWVWKYSRNGKDNYRLIPSWNNEKQRIPEMNDEEKQKMNIFVENAEKIIYKGI